MKGLIVFTIIVFALFAGFGLFAKSALQSAKQSKQSVMSLCISQGHSQADCMLEEMGQQTITKTGKEGLNK